MKQSKGVAVVLAALLVLIAGGCGLSDDAGLNEIRVRIRLDLKEDIGLLLTEWDANGQNGMSGVSNADRSMVKRDGTEYWTLDRQFLDEPADSVHLTLRFIIVTEYYEPNYDFDFPEGSMIPTDAITFTADFGKTYDVRISGDRINGFQALAEAAKTAI